MKAEEFIEKVNELSRELDEHSELTAIIMMGCKSHNGTTFWEIGNNVNQALMLGGTAAANDDVMDALTVIINVAAYINPAFKERLIQSMEANNSMITIAALDEMVDGECKMFSKMFFDNCKKKPDLSKLTDGEKDRMKHYNEIYNKNKE